MTHDILFKELCSPAVIRAGWYLAQDDSRDDFIIDPIGHVDFASNLSERLSYLIEEVQCQRYRPSHIIDVDIPKSGLSVRPGNVLPIQEATLLHAITYVLAPRLDKKLSESVFSYRLHENWEKKAKKRESIFRDGSADIPFLKRKTIHSISPFETWYEAWADFEANSTLAHTEEGYTHLTKTDISAFFENIDLHLLKTQLRSVMPRDEHRIVEILFRILDSWTRETSAGEPIRRGIPQGNNVSSFLANLYLLPLDQALSGYCKKRSARWS